MKLKYNYITIKFGSIIILHVNFICIKPLNDSESDSDEKSEDLLPKVNSYMELCLCECLVG